MSQWQCDIVDSSDINVFNKCQKLYVTLDYNLTVLRGVVLHFNVIIVNGARVSNKDNFNRKRIDLYLCNIL